MIAAWRMMSACLLQPVFQKMLFSWVRTVACAVFLCAAIWPGVCPATRRATTPGVVTYQQLAASEMDPRPTTTLQEALITDFPTADASTSLSDLYGAAGSGLPIAVTDERERLLAVVEPAQVLAHLSGDATAAETPANKEHTHAQPR